MLAFAEDERLARVQAQHAGLADLEAARPDDLRGVRGYRTANGRAFAGRWSTALAAVSAIRERGPGPALLRKLLLALLRLGRIGLVLVRATYVVHAVVFVDLLRDD